MNLKDLEFNISGIYKITSPSGKVYIGQAKCIKKRWYSYNSLSCKNQTRLYRSFKYYGLDNHKFEIIHICGIEELNEMEYNYQVKFQSTSDEKGLNCFMTEPKSKKKTQSEETKAKRSKGNHARARKVLNTDNGHIYECIKEVSDKYNINYSLLVNKLNGVFKNDTSFVLINPKRKRVNSNLLIVAKNMNTSKVIKGSKSYIRDFFNVDLTTISRYIRNGKNSNGWVFTKEKVK